MRMLIPVGLLLIVLGTGGSIAACYPNSATDEAARLNSGAAVEGNTDTLADENDDSGRRLYLAPLSGLALAIGLVCVGIGMGNWRRPIPSDVRPANPWNDQPVDNPNERPRGLV